MEQRSNRLGDTVGSCVDIMILVPLWRWRRIADKRDSVKTLLSLVLFMYLCDSSSATTRPKSVFCSRKRLRHISNKEHACSAVTHGQDRSTMVSWPL